MRTTDSPRCCCTAGRLMTSRPRWGRCWAAGWRCTTSTWAGSASGASWGRWRGGSTTRWAESRSSGLGGRRRALGPGWRWGPWRVPSTSGRSCSAGPGTWTSVPARTLERGAMVTAMLMLFSRSVADAEDRLRGDLLADLLAGRGLPLDRLRLRGPVRHTQRVDVDEPGGVLAAALGSDPGRGGAGTQTAPHRHRAARESVASAGPTTGSSVVVGDDDPLRVGRVAARAPRRRHLRRLHRYGSRVGYHGGLGRGPATLGGAAPAGARWRGQRSGRPRAGPPVLGGNGPGDLDAFVGRRLVRGCGTTATRDRARRDPGGVAGDRGRPAETARRLHVHPNTVAQRLDRVGYLLGDGWRKPDRELHQQLALQMWRLADSRCDSEP